MSTPQQAIESLYSVNVSIKGTPLPPIPRARVKEIVERDALACLGIDYQMISSPAPRAVAEPMPESVTKNDS